MIVKKLDEILKAFHEYNSFILTGHMNPDGDCVGSQISLSVLLKKWGKEVHIVNPGLPEPVFEFLPHYDWFSEQLPEADIEAAVIMDSGNMERTGFLKDYLQSRKIIINIDHHGHNAVPGDINYVDTSVSSVGEIIFRLFERSGVAISPEVALALYVSIMTDTGCFKHANTGARTHRIVADLIDAGDFLPYDVYNKVYEQESLQAMRLRGHILANLKTEGPIVWSKIRRDVFKKTGTTDRDLSGVIGYLRQLANCEVALLFYEKADGSVKVSFRSKNSFDLLPVVNSFGGGGHRGAAGATFEENIDVVEKKVLRSLREKLSNYDLS